MEKYLYTYLRGLSKSDLGTFGETLVLEKLKEMGFELMQTQFKATMSLLISFAQIQRITRLLVFR